MTDEKTLNLAYAAGLIDGEGTITLTIRKSKTGNKEYRYPVISVSSTTIELLDFMKMHYGGSIVMHKTYKAHHKEAHQWRLRGKSAVEFCGMIHPFLKERSKKQRAEFIFLNYDDVTIRNGRYDDIQHARKMHFQEQFFNI